MDFAWQGQQGDHIALRQKVVSFMRQHREDFEPYMEDDEPFDAYCKRMAEVGMQGIPSGNAFQIIDMLYFGKHAPQA